MNQIRSLPDPRLLQAGVLASLLAWQIGWLDFGASLPQAACTIAATLGTQAVTGRVHGHQWDWRREWRSPLVTGLSLSLLLRSHDPAIWLAAGVLAIGSKMLIRVSGRHVCNPACFGIVTLVLSGQAWVSPGQWGALAWVALLLGGAGSLVLGQARRAGTAAAFLLSYAALLLLRSLRLGDPLTIPWHQMQSGALLIFALFMVTDPRTTPARSGLRVAYAALVALLAFELQFGWQLREGFFYALALACPLVPVLDRLPPWPHPVPETGSCALAASPFSPLPR